MPVCTIPQLLYCEIGAQARIGTAGGHANADERRLDVKCSRRRAKNYRGSVARLGLSMPLTCNLINLEVRLASGATSQPHACTASQSRRHPPVTAGPTVAFPQSGHGTTCHPSSKDSSRDGREAVPFPFPLRLWTSPRPLQRPLQVRDQPGLDRHDDPDAACTGRSVRFAASEPGFFA